MVEGNLILDRYRPIELKGEGGSGTVEICWDTRIQRRVAIKRLPIAAADVGGSVPGLAEARTGAMLNHPSIVSVIDFETNADEAFLIMEAIEGPTLAQLIDLAPDNQLSLDVAAAVVQALGEALDFAHENQVLHLDIKPQNILVDMTGHIKVSDFGVSELADAQGFGEASGGTIGYMPPEQMRGEDLDQRCDEFAFAMVVYEMLTGECPFSAATLDQSTALIENFDIAAPSAFRDDIAPELDATLLAALDPQRAMRYLTVLDFADAIEPALGDPKAGILELKELAEIDDEEPEAILPETRDAGAAAGTRRIRPAGRVAMFALCWLVTGFALTRAGILSTGASTAVALVAGLFGAIAPAPAGVFSLGAYGVSCIGTTVASAFAQDSTGFEAAQALMGVAWLLSAVFMAGACTRRRRVSSVLLGLIAAALPAAAFLATSMPATGRASFTELAWMVVAIAASICLVIVGTYARLQQRGEQ